MSSPLLSRCEHPIKIKDPHIEGAYLYVPCGHCSLCHHLYRSKWRERLELESKSSVAVLFFYFDL